MADIGRGLFLLLIICAMVFAGVGAWQHFTDPRIQAHRDAELDRQEDAAAALQPTLDLAKRAMILIGVGFIAGMVIILQRFLYVRAQRVYPARGGLYPAMVIAPSLFQRAVSFLLGEPMPETKFLLPPNQPKAQLAYSAANGLNPGVRLSSAVWRQLMKPDDAAPEEEPLQLEAPLPTYANVYSAALPHTLALPLGETGDGQVSVPLRNMGSIIIGGLPGKGKSECVASMIVNLMRQDAQGQHVRLAVCDLKGGLDFGHIPSDLAMMEYPVARTPDAVMGLTEQVWIETQRRQKILFSTKDAHIDAYNKNHSPAIPFLILIIDELMMMSMAATDRGAPPEDKRRSEQFNSILIRIGAEGRATGVSVIAATQKPSAEVIPTLFRDICGTGIAFWCSRNHQSIAILGESGAEDLPSEPGVALVRMGDGHLTRIRTYHAGIEEGRFLNFVKRQPRSDRLALPADAGADNNPDGSDIPDGVAPGVIGGLGGVINGEFRAYAGVTDTPGEVRSHLEGPPEADLIARARDALPVTLDARVRLTEQQSALVWQVMLTTLDPSANMPIYSLRQTHATIWPNIEPGGHKARQIREAVDAEAARRNLTPRAVAGRGIVFTRQNGRAVRINGGRQ